MWHASKPCYASHHTYQHKKAWNYVYVPLPPVREWWCCYEAEKALGLRSVCDEERQMRFLARKAVCLKSKGSPFFSRVQLSTLRWDRVRASLRQCLNCVRDQGGKAEKCGGAMVGYSFEMGGGGTEYGHFKGVPPLEKSERKCPNSRKLALIQTLVYQASSHPFSLTSRWEFCPSGPTAVVVNPVYCLRLPLLHSLMEEPPDRGHSCVMVIVCAVFAVCSLVTLWCFDGKDKLTNLAAI